MFSFSDLKNKQVESMTIDLSNKSLALANKIVNTDSIKRHDYSLSHPELTKLAVLADELFAHADKVRRENKTIFSSFLEQVVSTYLSHTSIDQQEDIVKKTKFVSFTYERESNGVYQAFLTEGKVKIKSPFFMFKINSIKAIFQSVENNPYSIFTCETSPFFNEDALALQVEVFVYEHIREKMDLWVSEWLEVAESSQDLRSLIAHVARIKLDARGNKKDTMTQRKRKAADDVGLLIPGSRKEARALAGLDDKSTGESLSSVLRSLSSMTSENKMIQLVYPFSFVLVDADKNESPMIHSYPSIIAFGKKIQKINEDQLPLARANLFNSDGAEVHEIYKNQFFHDAIKSVISAMSLLEQHLSSKHQSIIASTKKIVEAYNKDPRFSELSSFNFYYKVSEQTNKDSQKVLNEHIKALFEYFNQASEYMSMFQKELAVAAQATADDKRAMTNSKALLRDTYTRFETMFNSIREAFKTLVEEKTITPSQYLDLNNTSNEWKLEELRKETDKIVKHDQEKTTAVDEEKRKTVEFSRVGEEVPDVTSDEQLAQRYGVNGINFAESPTNAERLLILKKYNTVFFDLARILGIEMDEVCFRKSLCITFGTHTKAGSAATYRRFVNSETNAMTHFINFSLSNGDGTISHELVGHALSHSIKDAIRNNSLSVNVTELYKKVFKRMMTTSREEFISGRLLQIVELKKQSKAFKDKNAQIKEEIEAKFNAERRRMFEEIRVMEERLGSQRIYELGRILRNSNHQMNDEYIQLRNEQETLKQAMENNPELFEARARMQLLDQQKAQVTEKNSWLLKKGSQKNDEARALEMEVEMLRRGYTFRQLAASRFSNFKKNKYFNIDDFYKFATEEDAFPSLFYLNGIELDGYKKKEHAYYSDPEEMFARSMSCFIDSECKRLGIENTYLQRPIPEVTNLMSAFPQSERAEIIEACRLFLRELVTSGFFKM